MKAKHGFTLVEILIVVVILGILAAIVIPQFTEASTEAKNSSLASTLQTMRSQIELYKIQHNDALPIATSHATFETCMTKYTNIDGTLATTQAPGQAGVFGPYMQKIPVNPFTTGNGVNGAATDGSVQGWTFNTTTGKFAASNTGADAAGTNYVDY
jgi:general secretion pathway protein G